MARLSRSRMRTLELRLRPVGPPIDRLLFLIPDLWPEADHTTFNAPRDPDELDALIVRRTGVLPTFGLQPFWAVTVRASEEMLALDEADRAPFLERHETRPRKAGSWGGPDPCH